MTKMLSAKEKADELGISTNGLAKTRHLYKHIKKSPRKYLYFIEEESEAIRPNKVGAPYIPDNSRSPKVKRRDVPFGDTQYHKAKGRGGEHFKILNQMRSKVALESKIPPEKLNDFNEALAHKINENYEEINEQRKAKLRMDLIRRDEETRKMMQRRANPIKNVGGMKYPYTNIAYPTSSSSNWKAEDRRSDEENKNRSWTDLFPKKYTYYG